MPIDTTLKISDLAIIIATALGPVFAVQAQKAIERRRSVHAQRLTIFRTLMATRATRLSQAHVEAINAIPVEFYGSGIGLKEIQDRWHSYQDRLNEDANNDSIGVRRNEAFMDLLFSISKYLGYRFSRSELERDVYFPTGHVELETDQIAIRKGLAKFLSGDLIIPMAVKELPSNIPADGPSKQQS